MFKFRASYEGKSKVFAFGDESSTIGDFCMFLEKDYELQAVKILKLLSGTAIESSSPECPLLLSSCCVPKKTKKITIIGATVQAVQRAEEKRVEQQRLDAVAQIMSIESTKKVAKKKARSGKKRYAYGPETKQDNVFNNSGGRNYCFGSVEVRKDLNKWEEAKKLVYSIVNDPALLKVMEKYRWHVNLVGEITPWEEPDKLGWNRNSGHKIALRLRSGRNHFLSREEIMETMFHEMAHNDIGPHNAEFRALNDQIREDYFDFVETLDEPERFTGIGVKLGGFRDHVAENPKEMARRAALARHVQLLYKHNNCDHDHDDHEHDDEDGDSVMEEN